VELKEVMDAGVGLLRVDFQGLRVDIVPDTLLGVPVDEEDVPVGVGGPRN
jgi:hypothetical protein